MYNLDTSKNLHPAAVRALNYLNLVEFTEPLPKILNTHILCHVRNSVVTPATGYPVLLLTMVKLTFLLTKNQKYAFYTFLANKPYINNLTFANDYKPNPNIDINTIEVEWLTMNARSYRVNIFDEIYSIGGLPELESFFVLLEGIED